MGHVNRVKQLFLSKGFSEEQFKIVKEVLFSYYKQYLDTFEELLGLMFCNQNDFKSLLKIALSSNNLDHLSSELVYNIYSRYFPTETQQREIGAFDLYDYWTSLSEYERKSPDEELFEKILQLL